MSKKRKISDLREKIMCDTEKLNLFLELIASDKIETLKEIYILADLALFRSRQIRKNNEKIGKILNC